MPRITSRTPKGKAPTSIAELHQVEVNPLGVPLLASASFAELLAHVLHPVGAGDPVFWAIVGATEDLEIFRVLALADDIEPADRLMLSNTLLRVQTRLRVSAELHRRQLAALGGVPS